MLIQVALIVLSTLMATMSGVLLWMLKDRLAMAKNEGAVSASICEHAKRLVILEQKVDSAVARHEYEDLQKTVNQGLTETREELRGIRKEISQMALIMARAVGENGSV